MFPEISGMLEMQDRWAPIFLQVCWLCPVIKAFWEMIHLEIKNITGILLPLEVTVFLFNDLKIRKFVLSDVMIISHLSTAAVGCW